MRYFSYRTLGGLRRPDEDHDVTSVAGSILSKSQTYGDIVASEKQNEKPNMPVLSTEIERHTDHRSVPGIRRNSQICARPDVDSTVAATFRPNIKLLYDLFLQCNSAAPLKEPGSHYF